MKNEIIGSTSLYNGDCLKVMPTLTDGSIDCIIADLPYAVLNKSNPSAIWDKEIDMDKMWKQIWRVLKPNGACILFGQGLFSAKLMMSQPKLYRYSLVWDKVLKSGFLNANRMPLRRHEDILVFYRILPTYNPQMMRCEPHQRNHVKGTMIGQTVNRCYGNYVNLPTTISDEKYPTSIVSIPKEHINGEFWHPTCKPVALLEYLIRTYSNEGETILDFTMGSGSTMVACANTNRNGVGIELMSEYYDIAVKRVKDAIAQPRLFNL